MRTRSLLLGALTVAAASCLHLRPIRPQDTNAGDRIVITQEMIERSQGKTAWEVLKIEVPDFTFGEQAGEPTKLERRGKSTFLLNDMPQLYLDGTRLTELRDLQEIQASTLKRIEILNSLDGTTLYGTDAEGGVILMFSKNGNPET